MFTFLVKPVFLCVFSELHIDVFFAYSGVRQVDSCH